MSDGVPRFHDLLTIRFSPVEINRCIPLKSLVLDSCHTFCSHFYLQTGLLLLWSLISTLFPVQHHANLMFGGLLSFRKHPRNCPRTGGVLTIVYVLGSYNGFIGKYNGPKIDYIMVKSDIEVIEASILKSNSKGRYPSDHFPVTAQLRIKK